MQQVPEDVPLPSPALGSLPSIVYWCQGTWKALKTSVRQIAYRLNRLLPKDGSEIMTGALPLKNYTIAALPSPPPLGAGALAYVSNAAAGRKLQYWTGAGWEPDGLLLPQIPGRFVKRTVFTSGGTFTPDATTTAVDVWVLGGGGGGGGVPTTGATTCALGGGGSGGGQARKWITSAFSGVTITIGAGGAGGSAGANPGAGGGTTSFGALVSATGGQGGLAGSAIVPPSIVAGTGGGVGSSGDWNATGGTSSVGFMLTTTVITGCRGGGSFPFGPDTAGRQGSFAGNAAAAGFGNGGSGATAAASSASALAGGTGNAGLCIVDEWQM